MGKTIDFCRLGNGQAVKKENIPVVDFNAFRQSIIAAVEKGARLSAVPVWQDTDKTALRVMAVLSFPASAQLGLMASTLADRWPSLTPECPAAHWFEREIAEQ